MQSMQRSFGKLLNKAPGDNAKVSAVLNDYEDADKVLAKLIENARSWRDSWVLLVNSQVGIVTEYEGLYDPIEGTGRTNVREAVPTPELQLHRTFALKQAYADLRTDLLEDLDQIETGIIKPATDARDCIAPIRKTIKKRENRRLDYEKAQDKAVKLQRKPGKNAKEETALAKAEDEVARAADEFQVVDNHVRETLPPIVNAAFSIVPPLLSQIVVVQNRLLGLYYTVLHGYCEQHNFPSPPPPMEDVIAAWQADFGPARKDIESISIIASGKAARQPMHATIEPPATDGRKASSSSLTSFRRNPTAPLPASNTNGDAPPGPMPPRPNRIPSAPIMASPGPRPNMSSAAFASSANLGIPTDFTTASGYGNSPGASPSSLRPRTDYFGDGGSGPTRPLSRASTMSTASTSISPAAILAKKKPPPPPPPKRIASMRPDEFVVAQYPFTGQNQGDLSFEEGARIKVVKKTGTDQDWWVGELGGGKGNFPANYCKAD